MDTDEWDSSVWATPATPSNLDESLKIGENKSTNSELVPSQSQTVAFSVDDAFDDKSAPTTPGFFSTKLPASNIDSSDAFGEGADGARLAADDGFGDFDNFAAPASGQALDDDFGDFGEFGDGGNESGFGGETSNGFGDVAQDGFEGGGFGTGVFNAPAHWQPLQVDPLPSSKELAEELGELLGPIWAHLRPEEFMSDEPERQVEGVAQILVTPERYFL